MATETAHKEGSRLDLDSPSPPESVHLHGGRGDGDTDGDAAADADGASSNDHVDEKTPPAAPITKKQKFKRHCGKFWWWYAIAGLVLLIILLPILFTVIIPAIVQAIVTGQKLPVYSGSFQAVSPTELTITLSTSLKTPLKASLDELEMHLYNKGTEPYTPFLTLTLPKMTVDGKKVIDITNQTVQVENETELISWFDDIFELPETDLSIKAKPTVHLSSLKYHPDLEKTITLPSLNHLDGFAIKDLEFIFPAKDNGINMQGHLNLPNAGTLQLGLGNLTFNVLSGKTKLGLINIYDVNLKPGDNAQSFDGTLDFSALVPNLAAILDSQKTALGDGNVELNVTGNATYVNGQHIKYVESVLNKKTLTAQVPVITLLSDVVNGLVNNDNVSLFDVIGDVFGNSTLLEGALDRFAKDGDLNSTAADAVADSITNNRRKAKRTAPGSSLMWSMLRMGMKARKSAR